MPAERRHQLLGLEELAQVLGCRGAEKEQRFGDQVTVARRAGAEGGEPAEIAGGGSCAGFGGVVSISDVTSFATLPSSSSKSGRARASAAE